MSARSLHEYLDRTGTLRSKEGLSVRVEVMDARHRFGTVDLRVSPINGSGETWVEARRVELDPLD